MRDGLRPKPAPGSLALVQGFVNTRNIMHGYDLLEDVDGAAAWLVEFGLLDEDVRLGEGARDNLVRFREALRGVLLSHNGGGVGGGAGALNEVAEDALLRVRFDGEGMPGLLPAGSGTPDGGVAARLLVAAVGALGEGTWRRLKVCRNEGCMWAFYDGSKNRSGSWCTMDVCGSRAKMRAYRRRKS
ncbi:MAG TPA: CGNR zinc finger domain-containing protein [Rubrobacter sp.]|nr:CGNR zinc finger domain-containing protein [Rubrobacter sp.]